MLVRVLEYPDTHGWPYRPRGRFTLITADILVKRGLLTQVAGSNPAYYTAQYDPRSGEWA